MDELQHPTLPQPAPCYNARPRSTLPLLARLLAQGGHDSRARFIGQEGRSPLTLARQCRSQAEPQTVFASLGRA